MHVFDVTALPLTVWSTLATTAARDEVEFVTELRNLPEGWLAVAGLALVVAICWAVVWMYRREGRIGASRRVRASLALLRCAVLLTLAAVILEPVRIRVLRRWIDSYALLLVDDSSSMDLADVYRDESVAERVKRVLGKPELEPTRRTTVVDRVVNRDDRRFLRDLAGHNRVKLYTFGEEPELRGIIRAAREDAQARSSPGPSSDTLLGVDDVSIALAATGPATNIERAVRRAVESLGRAPIAAVSQPEPLPTR